MTHQVTARRYYIKTSCLSSPASVPLIIIIDFPTTSLGHLSPPGHSLPVSFSLDPSFAKFHRNSACPFKMLFNVSTKYSFDCVFLIWLLISATRLPWKRAAPSRSLRSASRSHLDLISKPCIDRLSSTRAKEAAKRDGGVIRHVYKIIKGFTSVNRALFCPFSMSSLFQSQWTSLPANCGT